MRLEYDWPCHPCFHPCLVPSFYALLFKSKQLEGLDRLFCRDDVDRIKNFAYNEGKQTAYYGSMIGVIIRDKYFESKGIQPSEVDDNDPTR